MIDNKPNSIMTESVPHSINALFPTRTIEIGTLERYKLDLTQYFVRSKGRWLLIFLLIALIFLIPMPSLILKLDGIEVPEATIKSDCSTGLNLFVLNRHRHNQYCRFTIEHNGKTMRRILYRAPLVFKEPPNNDYFVWLQSKHLPFIKNVNHQLDYWLGDWVQRAWVLILILVVAIYERPSSYREAKKINQQIAQIERIGKGRLRLCLILLNKRDKKKQISHNYGAYRYQQKSGREAYKIMMQRQDWESPPIKLIINDKTYFLAFKVNNYSFPFVLDESFSMLNLTNVEREGLINIVDTIHSKYN